MSQVFSFLNFQGYMFFAFDYVHKFTAVPSHSISNALIVKYPGTPSLHLYNGKKEGKGK